MTVKGQNLDAADLIVGDIGAPVPWVAPRLVSFQTVNFIEGGGGTCVTFEAPAEGGTATGRLLIKEDCTALCARIDAARKRGALLVLWGTVMIERHPGGEKWMTGWIESAEPS